MAVPPAAIPALLTSEDSFIYHTVAASMFIFWDHCITFGQEVDFIWRSKGSVINCLFYAIRYLTFIIRVVHLVVTTNAASFVHPSRTICVAWLWFETISGLVLFICVETVLVIRVFAFYGRNKTLLAFIVALFVAEMVSQVAIIAITVPSIDTIPDPLPSTLDTNACLVINIPSLFPSLWVPGLVFESFLFSLVTGRFIWTRRRGGISSTPGPLLVVFVRDGTWAFVLIFVTLLWTALTIEMTGPMGGVSFTWLYPILALCGTRLILNLRYVAEKRETEPAFDVTLELIAAQNPALEPSLVTEMIGPALGTAT